MAVFLSSALSTVDDIMKIGMTLLVKNEIDIIETHVRYHRPKVDFIVAMDNMSTDGTYEKLQDLSREYDGITVLTMASKVYDQSLWVSRMVRHCEDLGADWVVNSDADEFFVGDLKYVIGEFWRVGANIVYPDGTTFWPTEMDDLSVADPVRRLLWCDGPQIPFGNKKAIHVTKGFSHVEQGNHFVRFLSPIRDHIQETPSLLLYHYPFRSEQQFVSKHRGVWSSTKLSQMGVGWQGINNVFVEGGEESLKKYYHEQIVFSQDRAEKRGLVRNEMMLNEIRKS